MRERSQEVLAFAGYLAEVRRPGGRRRYSERSIDLYATVAERVRRSGGNFIQALQEAKPGSWHTILCVTLAWMRWKQDAEGERRARDILPPPAGHSETKSIDPTEWARIEEAIPPSEPERSVVLLIVTSGLRVNDVFRIDRRQAELALTNSEIEIYQKGNRLRGWTPGGADMEALSILLRFPAWRIVRDLVDPYKRIPIPDGRQYTDIQHYRAAYHRVRTLLLEAAKKAGLAYVRPHRFRHTAATLAVENGYTEVDVQRMLGHADSRSTSKFYLHSGAKRQAAVKQSLDALRTRSKQ